MFDDEDGAVKLQKSRTMTVSFNGNLDELVKAISDAVPELNESSFTINSKNGVAEYFQLRTKTLLNAKVALELKIQQISDTKYHITYAYRTKQIRFVFFLFVCLGLLFGLVPGLIIYYMFRESDTEEVQKVTPVLDRFGALVAPIFERSDENLTLTPNQKRVEPSTTDENGVIKQLEKLTALKDSGAIDDAEFVALKSKLIEKSENEGQWS